MPPPTFLPSPLLPIHPRCSPVPLRSPLCCADSSLQDKFDRVYFPSLKADYAHLPNVHLYARDDYHPEPLSAPYLYDNRARHLPSIRAANRHRPPDPADLPSPQPPLRRTDLHTSDEIAAFAPQMRNADVASGRVWDDPMPESDFEELDNEQWIHFRRYDKREEQADRGEAVFEGCQAVPRRKARVYESFEEERADLAASVERMQDDWLDLEEGGESWGETERVPEKGELERWKRAARERGGNSTQDNSFFLSPVRPREEEDSEEGDERNEEDGEKAGRVPDQFESLVGPHRGRWEGWVRVWGKGEGWSDAREVWSEMSEVKEGIEWSVGIEEDGMEVLSQVLVEEPKFRESLVPERAVSAEGSFVAVGMGMSMSARCLGKVAGMKGCLPEVEVCMLVKGGEVGMQRHRVFLCCSDEKAEGNGRGKKKKGFEKVIVIMEVKVKGQRVGVQREFIGGVGDLLTASLRDLEGVWSGKGFVMHPHFPPMQAMEVATKYELQSATHIALNDVSWTEPENEDIPGVKDRARQKQMAKKKVSRRVAVARAHDRQRLTACSILSTEDGIGDAQKESQAWQAIPSELDFSTLRSPRLGKFVDDYFGLVLPGSFLITFPERQAFPKMWNTITMTQIHAPARKRITVGRNAEGDLVGVLFISETITEMKRRSELCDEVAAYV